MSDVSDWVMMQQTALVTGADRGLGFALSAQLLAQGWRVIAGQYLHDWPELAELAARFPDTLHVIPLDVGARESTHAAAQLTATITDRVDLLISNAGVNSPTSPRAISESQDYDEMQRLYNVNALGALRMVEAFLPLLALSALKRLCFVSSEAGSIGGGQRTSWYGYCMSKAALNMATQILFNDLRPVGYTFRVYHPGWVRSYINGKKNLQADLEPEEAATAALAYFLPARDDDDWLVLRDWEGKEWPW